MASSDAQHVFISYVNEDTAEVDKLCAFLTQAGIPYWRDRQDLQAGDAWRAKIRDAIRDGSLVFLACFSENSRAKRKSYMNEELTLAVDEFRMRPPGATWLIPIRFDDGEVPAYDLGAGLVLSDLNYADLFGDRYAAQAVGLVTTINRVMGVAVPTPASAVAAIEDSAAADRKLLLRRSTKEMLLDPKRRIELDDLVRAETRRIIAAISDKSVMPVNRTPEFTNGDTEYVISRALAIAELTEPLCWSIQVAARWAEPDTFSIWTDSLRALVAESSQIRGGVVSLLGLTALPTLMVMTTGAVAAHAQGQWKNLHGLVSMQVANSTGQTEALLNVVSPYVPFSNTDSLPNLLAHLAESQDRTSITDLVGQQRLPKKYTPVSDWLLARLGPAFEEQFIRNADFEHALTETEVFLGVVSEDEAHAEPESAWRSSSWFGRATWQDRYRGGGSLDQLESLAVGAGSEWGPLKAGFFGGSTKRLNDALEGYREAFNNVSRRR